MSRCSEVRLATDADLAAVLVLERAMAEAPHWPEAVYRKYVRGAAGGLQCKALFVAVAEDAVQGYAAATVLHEEAELESIAVAEASRRCGWGGRLLDAVETWGREHGAGRLLLEVRSNNGGACDFYRARGFSEKGMRRRYYRDPVDDAVLLRRELRR